MTSKNEKLNDFLKFVKIHNKLSEKNKITQLEALKAYIEMIKTA